MRSTKGDTQIGKITCVCVRVYVCVCVCVGSAGRVMPGDYVRIQDINLQCV